MKACIKNEQIWPKGKDVGSQIYFKNALWTIETIYFSVPGSLRKRFNNDKYTYCSLNKIKDVAPKNITMKLRSYES